jgi:hypothetical protein
VNYLKAGLQHPPRPCSGANFPSGQNLSLGVLEGGNSQPQAEIVSPSLYTSTETRAPVAQGTEHPPSKRQVAGSNPAWGTSTESRFQVIRVTMIGTAHLPRPCPSLPLVAFATFAAFATFHNEHPASDCSASVPILFRPELRESPT